MLWTKWICKQNFNDYSINVIRCTDVNTTEEELTEKCFVGHSGKFNVLPECVRWGWDLSTQFGWSKDQTVVTQQCYKVWD